MALSVATNYLSILFAQENLKNAEARLALVESQLEQVRKFINAGSRPQSEEYQLLAEVANSEQDIVSFENQYTQNLLALKQLLRLEPDFPMQVEAPEITLDEIERLETSTFTSVYNAALESQPQIEASQLRVQSAERGVQIAKSNYTPSLSAGVSIGTNFSDLAREIAGTTVARVPIPGVYINDIPVQYEIEQQVPTGFNDVPYFDQLDNNLGYGLGVSLSIPIYNNDQARAATDRAKLNYMQAVNSDEQVRQFLKTDVQDALLQAKSARKALDAAQRSFDANQVAFEQMEKRYNIGASNTYEYIQARNSYDQAEVNLTVARYDYIFRIIVLEYYMGRGIDFE